MSIGHESGPRLIAKIRFLASQQVRPILTALKCVLVIGPWIVGNLNTAATLVGILKEVHIGTFVESMVARCHFCARVKVMDISEAAQKVSQTTLLLSKHGVSYRVATFSSPGLVAIAMNALARLWRLSSQDVRNCVIWYC